MSGLECQEFTRADKRFMRSRHLILTSSHSTCVATVRSDRSSEQPAYTPMQVASVTTESSRSKKRLLDILAEEYALPGSKVLASEGIATQQARVQLGAWRPEEVFGALEA